jgi:FK506-binding nuclear protein
MKVRGGVRVEDLVAGSGPIAERGSVVVIRYSGFLNKGDAFQTDVTARFTIGERRVIAGLEYGVEGMHVGGRRRIHVAPHLGYAENGAPGVPPNAKLTLDVELLEVQAPATAADE